MFAQGAEAIITEEENYLVKTRLKKGYRHSEIDLDLRRKRTKREVNVLRRLFEKKVPVPMVLSYGEDWIKLEKLEGKTATELLDDEIKAVEIARELGKIIGLIHEQNINHGDLTPSNFIVGEKMYAIDFGLSFYSHKVEDKATDLHVLEEALKARHPSHWKKYWTEFLNSYAKLVGKEKFRDIENRLEKISLRGRYKHKQGNHNGH